MDKIRLYIAAVAISLGFAFGALAQPAPVPVQSPAVTQNTVTTTAPVTSSTTIDVGTYAGQALMWVASVFGVPIGGLITAWVFRLFKLAGIQATDAMRARLQEMVVNGLNAGAQKASQDLKGKGTVEVKNAVVASTIAYVQTHGGETLQQLGIDPNSNAAVDAIKARIETAIADPTVPTPAVLDAPVPAAPKT